MKRNAESDESIQPQDLARTIRECRKAEGMKQVTLAALAGVTERTVQRLEERTLSVPEYVPTVYMSYLRYRDLGKAASSS